MMGGSYLFSIEGRVAVVTGAGACIGANRTTGGLIGPTLFLCSRAGAYVTGQILNVDGGFSAK